MLVENSSPLVNDENELKSASTQSSTGKLLSALNEQTSQQIFLNCLLALQTHGDEAETSNLLVNLAYLINDRFKYKEAFYNVLAQIPGLNQQLLDEFVFAMSKTTPPHVREKYRKDLFKRIVQPIVGGKAISSRFKTSEINIRDLPSYELITERKKQKIDLERVNELLDYNICSIFDSLS